VFSPPRLSVVIAASNALRWLPGAVVSLGAWAGSPRPMPGSAPLSTPCAGLAAAGNAGLAAAQAPLIAFLDAGDR
jgi:hypothetical protein